MSIIALLPDEPNDVGGLSAEQLKEKFDEGGNALKEYLNKTLIPEVEAAIEAAALGVPSGNGIDGRIIVDGSLTSGKYAPRSVDEDAIADGAMTEPKVANRAITGIKVAKDSIGREHLTEDATMLKTTDFPNKVVPGRALDDNTVEGHKIAKKTLTHENIADETIVPANLNPSAKPVSAANVSPTSWTQDDTYEDYPYKAAIAIEGVTTGHHPEVVFNPSDAASGNYANVSETYDGGVYIYAETDSELPTIPSIVCFPMMKEDKA